MWAFRTCFCLLFSSFLTGFGCTSTEKSFSNHIDVTDSDTADTTNMNSDIRVVESHSGPQSSSDLESVECVREVSYPYLLVLNSSSGAFPQSGFCSSDETAKELLRAKYNVLAVNRPGFGLTAGKDIFGDKESVGRIAAFLNKAQGRGKIVQGVLALDEASLSAFALAAKVKFDFLIIGNGLFDWEATLKESQDRNLIARMREAQAMSRDSDFVELRSIAWDFSKLPKKVYLFHDASNPSVPLTQASSFKDALLAGEYVAELFVIANQSDPPGRARPLAALRQILEKLAIMPQLPQGA